MPATSRMTLIQHVYHTSSILLEISDISYASYFNDEIVALQKFPKLIPDNETHLLYSSAAKK